MNQVPVELPHGVGRQTRTVRLRLGDWFVEWPGSSGVARVTVTAGTTPEVKLTTLTGRCEKDDGKCLVISRAKSKRIEIVVPADTGS